MTSSKNQQALIMYLENSKHIKFDYMEAIKKNSNKANGHLLEAKK